MEPGTWTELIGAVAAGSVAMVLGLMAYFQGRKANFWAHKAADAQTRANEIAEAGLGLVFAARLVVPPVLVHELGAKIDVAAELEWLVSGTTVEVGLPEGSGSVHVQDVESLGARFWPPVSPPGVAFDAEQALHNMYDKAGGSLRPVTSRGLPEQIHGGEHIAFHQPWLSHKGIITEGDWARVLIHYSVTEDSDVRDVEVAVELPPPPTEEA